VEGGKQALSPPPKLDMDGHALAGFCGQRPADEKLVERQMALRNPVFVILFAGVSGLALSGCVSSPTYGTGKSANEQLLEDVSNIANVVPKGDKEKINYTPRPELVRPAVGAPLPPPQENAKASANWPESPEDRRARLRAEATAAQDDPFFVPKIKNDGFGVNNEKLTPAEQQAKFRAARKVNTTGSGDRRAFLSEPPLDYRVPAETAPVGELGEDEKKKERRLKREASKGKGRTLRDLVPWL
jgi:type IV secretory pathway VirB10-like protein